jgi:hypothetical protein
MLSSVPAVVVGLGETLCAKAPVVPQLTAYGGCGMSCRLSRGVPTERAPNHLGPHRRSDRCKHPHGGACGETGQRQREAGDDRRACAEHGPGAVVDLQGVEREIDFIEAPLRLSARDVRDTAVRYVLEGQRGQEPVRARRTRRDLIRQGAAASGSECRLRSACHRRVGCPPGGFRRVPQAGRRARAARLRPGGRLRRRRRAPAPAARRP